MNITDMSHLLPEERDLALNMKKKEHFVSASCKGEVCSICTSPATHKIGEEIPHDDPCPDRHPFTAYTCCACFEEIFGDAVSCEGKE